MIAVKLKHAGKSYDAHVDVEQPALAFKQTVHELTGVDPAKVKIPVKGGMLKDDADMKKIGFKPGQTIMVIGAAGELPKAPTQPVKFMEDMSEAELAKATKFPVGLQNLGNTCYMNSTVQVLRSIPELNSALSSYGGSLGSGQSDAALASSLRDLYRDMGTTTEPFPPLVFIQMLRQHAPQFAERSREGGGFAQQDAEEAWSSIVNALAVNVNVQAAPSSSGEGQANAHKFVDQYLAGHMVKTMKSAEAPDEEPSVSLERFLELKCTISAQTNYLMSGIKDGLTNDIEKNSPSLGRSAVYQETARISRLPSYLTVHEVRFFWRRDIGKKTKIMRKVKFPFELDAIELVTDDLKRKMQPLNDRLKDVDRDRRERAKVRRRAKAAQKERARMDAQKRSDAQRGIERDPTLADEELKVSAEKATGKTIGGSAGAGADADVEMRDAGDGPRTTEGELVDEPTKRREEAEELRKLIDPAIAADQGANASGLYELAAIVTHAGASADGGHYVGWSRVPPQDTEGGIDYDDPDKQEWYRFDDDKVTVVSKDRIAALDGGGEAHCAYILLYRAKSLE